MRHRLYLMLFVVTLGACNSSSEKKSEYAASQNNRVQIDPDPLQESMERGSLIYQDFCMSCHMADGKGVPQSFPPLAGSDYLLNNRIKSIRAIKYGQSGEIVVNGETYNNVMSSLGLEDDEVADVMNYILNSWGNSQKEIVTEEEVQKVEK